MRIIKPKKSLGQNFLHDKNILKKIVSTANLEESDTVLEVGPGLGNLTEQILPAVKKVIAVEKDDRLIEKLKETFSSEIRLGKLNIIHADILELDFKSSELRNNDYKIVANLPYYITGQFLRKFLTGECQPKSITLLLQKEVAERIVQGQKQSLLSIAVKVYGEPKYIQTVSRNFFQPIPKVDSAILNIENINRKFFIENKISEKFFFKVLKIGFAQKRKILFKKLLQFSTKGELEKIFANCKIEDKCRAEELSTEKWACLVKKINKE